MKQSSNSRTLLSTRMRSLLLGAAMVGLHTLASAASFVVLPGDPSWSTIPGESSGGGSSTITATLPINGNGSIEMFGDRTRFSMGNYFSAASNLGLLSTVTRLTFDWAVAVGSTNPYNPDYTPALRLHIRNAAGTQRSELIWEGAYNGIYGNEVKGQVYSTGADDLFYQNISGQGVTFIGGSQVDRTLAQWIQSYGEGAYVNAISVGAGSGTGTGYHAFVDDVTFGINGMVNIYNFEVPSTSGNVPEPASIALLGLGLAGLLAARRKA